MRRMRKATFISLALLGLVLFAAHSSFACSCIRTFKPLKLQVTEAFKESAAIFSGEVISITPSSESEVAVKFKVGKSWKGKFAEEVIITTPQNGAMCGYTFDIGHAYLVYASGATDSLMTTNCSRTAVASQKQDIKFLDRLKRRKVKAS
jgi:hypothetical protein